MREAKLESRRSLHQMWWLSSWSDGKPEGASGGFGLTAEPEVTVVSLLPGTSLIYSSHCFR